MQHLIKDSLRAAKQRVCSVNIDINRLVFTCVRRLSEQLKNHIPKKISRQTGRKKQQKREKNKVIVKAIILKRNITASTINMKPVEYFRVI